MVIFLWKISQGLVSGYKIPFTDTTSRMGRRAVVPEVARRRVPALVQNAKENSLRVRGAQLFNLLPAVLRNANHGDTDMWKKKTILTIFSVMYLTNPPPEASAVEQFPTASYTRFH